MDSQHFLTKSLIKYVSGKGHIWKRSLLNFWIENNTGQSESWQKFTPRILLVIGTYFLLEKGIFRLTTLSFSTYYQSSIYLEFIKGLSAKIYPVLFLFFCIVIFNKRLFIKWSDFEQGKTIRNIVFLSIAILTWVYATYDYNFYFNQGHYLDRILLVSFALLVYWRPLFTVFFLTLLLTIVGQFEVLWGYSFAGPDLLIRLVVLFLAFFILRLLRKTLQFTDFVFITGCLVAAHYFISGLGKLNMEWILNDQVNYILPATYANGWLSFLNSESISRMTEILGWFNVPLKIFILLVECGLLFFYSGLKWARLLMFGAIMMHLGIFMFSGIFFYQWILILIGLLYFIFSKKDFHAKVLFNKNYLLLSLLLIAGGKFWCNPVRLAWHDTPLNYTYRFEAENINGNRVVLPPNYFAPYDYQFTLGNFKYLSAEPVLDITWGATGESTGRYFNSLRTDQQIYQYEKSHGTIYENKDLKERLGVFIKQFVNNWNHKSNRTDLWNYVGAPRLLWTYPLKSSIDGFEEIKTIRVNQVMTYYTEENGYMELRRRELYTIPIDFDFE